MKFGALDLLSCWKKTMSKRVDVAVSVGSSSTWNEVPSKKRKIKFSGTKIPVLPSFLLVLGQFLSCHDLWFSLFDFLEIRNPDGSYHCLT